MKTYFDEIPLWEKEPIPFRENSDAEKQEHFLQEVQDGIDRLTDVTRPAIRFFPVSGRGPHPAVLVCPGGGYGILAWNHEGIDICSYFNSIGFSAFLLKYRCPDRRAAAHADAARAMRLIRAKADHFQVDPCRIGILGFSAGAHLAATLSAPADPLPYEPEDEIDRSFSCRPDYSALIYPAYLRDPGKGDGLELQAEFKPDQTCPPVFLLQTQDDEIQAENSISWFLAMKRAGIKAELHIYPEGGHGYGILRTGKPVSNWPLLAADWFRRQAGLQ